MQLFCDEERPKLKAAVPEAKFGELNGLLAAKWKDAEAADKERFHKMSKVCHPLSMPVLMCKMGRISSCLYFACVTVYGVGKSDL